MTKRRNRLAYRRSWDRMAGVVIGASSFLRTTLVTRHLPRGRRTSSPPQFGQTLAIASVQAGQKVHS